MRFLSRRADHITVISNYSAAKLHELGLAPERISIIYPGVEWPATACSHNCISTQHASTRKKTILTVGRLVLRKGHDRVIEALPNVLERVSDVEYVIVGGGTEEQRLRNLAKAVGVEAAVTFVGSVPHDVVQRYYEAADVFVHPNRQLENGDVEGFGIVFLEANACGLPVIGGNSGGTPDAIRHGITGFLVDPNSSAEIGDRIVELLQNDAMRKRMGEEGRKWAAQFKWSHAAELIDKLSETVSRSHSRGRTP
jgi:phosphatidylinositol alpha-1,6-mannosyltransferase